MFRATALYFAFPDGVLDYNCKECSAICCKGHGFSANIRREASALLHSYSFLGQQVIGRSGDFIHFLTPASGCVLLAPDNSCSAQKAFGDGMKPTVCRLFPFNTLTRIGTSLVVSPHFVCPLRLVTPPQAGSVAGTHAAIRNEFGATGILEADIPFLRQPRLRSSDTPQDVIARESNFWSLCSSTLMSGTFTAMLAAEAGSAESPISIYRRLCRLLELRPTSLDSTNDLIDRLMCAVSPTLRLDRLHLEPGQLTLYLLLGEAFTRNVARSMPRAPGCQDVVRIFAEMAFLFEALSRSDQLNAQSILQRDTHVPSWFSHELENAYFTFTNLGARSSVLDALEAAVVHLSEGDRIQFVTYISRECTRIKTPYTV